MATRQQEPVRVTVDDREAGSPVLPALRALEDVAVCVSRLPIGDYSVRGSLLVERKTVPDLARSIRDGRLFRQAARLVQCSDARPCLIVEACTARHVRLAVPRHAVHGAMITMSLVYGLPVLRSTGPRETASLIRIAARQLRRRNERGPLRWVSKHGPDRRIRLLMLEAVPGVGPVRAASLLDAFGSIEAISVAPADQLAITPGIGIATARRLKQIVSGLAP